MDATEPPYSKLRYDFIVERLLDFLVNECRFKKEKVRFVPVSAFIGENVTKPPLPTSGMMSGLGQVPFTLLQSIDMFKIPPRPTASPLRVRFCTNVCILNRETSDSLHISFFLFSLASLFVLFSIKQIYRL
jgi:translation elongation factor EF-1alpha